jgi:FkbM family methyltransferase
MKKISFAQNQEDVLLGRLFANRSDGFYIDVGAFHPVFHSVTKSFYDRGWRGINIEPIPTMFEVLARDRVRDVNLPVGLSNREGTLLFHEVPRVAGFSTFSTERAEDLRREGYALIEHSIPVTTLARVCEQHAAPTIDFLKIDVEGHEREVLEGADWGRFRPRVVLVEATRPDTSIPSHDDWEALLLAADYLFAFFDGLNRYYLRVEDRELLPLLSVPVNVLDGFIPFEYHDRIQHLQRQVQELQLLVEQLRGSGATDAPGPPGRPPRARSLAIA